MSRERPKFNPQSPARRSCKTMLDQHAGVAAGAKTPVIDLTETILNLRNHLEALTATIGERSVHFPENLKRTAGYIESFYGKLGLPVHGRAYRYGHFEVANVVAELSFCNNPSKRYLLGAHYDTVVGTVGADDNASAVAVQLETARHLMALKGKERLDLAVQFVSFALEEPPAFATRHMGSLVYARQAAEVGEKIDGMICLEMVGYTNACTGCQRFPFPLMFFGYPKDGKWIGIVGNYHSREFTLSLFRSFQSNPHLPVVKLTVPFRGWLLPAVRLSDHSSFWDRGYKAVMVTDTAFYRNPHYHLPSDTMDKLDYGFMAQLVKSLLIFLCSHHP